MLKAIEEINEAKGNEKIEVLRKHKRLLPIFKYAYDPFMKFHITAPDLDGTEGGGTISALTKDILDRLTTRELSGNAALEEVCDHMVSLSPSYAEVFKRIINKDMRCGVNVKTINKAFDQAIPLVWDGSIKPPFMLLKTFTEKKCKWPCMAAVKKDGVRGQFIDHLISRQGKKLIGHQHIEKELTFQSDGELCVPGMGFDQASGIIRNESDTPESVFWIFDAPALGGTKKERWHWLLHNTEESNKVKLIHHYFIENYDQLIKFYKWALSEKEEGIVIYDPDSFYEDKRSYDWMRLVPIKSLDLKIIGFYEGKGKYISNLGGIIVDFNGTPVKVGTGFKDKLDKNKLKQLVSEFDKNLYYSSNKKVAQGKLHEISPIIFYLRDFIWQNKEVLMNCVAKVEYKEKTKKGSLRQPRFKGIRFDK